jgi:hypothetical protein
MVYHRQEERTFLRSSYYPLIIFPFPLHIFFSSEIIKPHYNNYSHKNMSFYGYVLKEEIVFESVVLDVNYGKK